MKYEVKLGDTYQWIEASTPYQACMICLRQLYEANWEVKPVPFFVTNLDSGEEEEVRFDVITGLLDLSNNFVYDENDEPPIDMNWEIVKAATHA